MAEDISILHEIDESLKLENMEHFLRRYGKLLIALVVIIIIATAVSVIMKKRHHQRNIAATSVLMQAEQLSEDKKYPEAIALLETIANEKNSVAALAQMRIAENYSRSGDFVKAEAHYATVANTKKADDALRGLAQLNAIILAHDHGLKVSEGNTDKSLAEKNTLGSVVAGEMLAVRLLNEGKKQEAREALDNIIKNPDINTGQKQRATELLDGFETIAVKEEKK